MAPEPHVFWLFGLSGVGKTTLTLALHRKLIGSLRLDGDRLRVGLCKGLGFADADRTENLRRAAEVARLGVESGLVVVAAFITPRREQRAMVRRIVGANRCSLIFVDAPLAICRDRDVKGLYAGARHGVVRQMTGVASDFEPGDDPDLRLDTERETVEQSFARLEDFASGRLGAVERRR